jgi:predicted ATPase
MLKKIYIHNFRCFENFELELDKLNLFIGANGVGKSSLFHVLHKIQTLINGTEKASVGCILCFLPEQVCR